MPMTLTEIRQQYPQYSDMSDQELSDSLYNKFYSDMPREQFDQQIGTKASDVPITGESMASPIGHRIAGAFEDVGKGAAGLGAGMVQGAAQAGYGIAQLGDTVLNKILGTHLEAPKPDVYVGAAKQLKGALPAEIGEAIGQYGPAGVVGAAPEALIPRMLTTAGATAVTQPGGLAERGAAGAIAGVGSGALDILSKAPNMFVGKLAKNLEKLYARQRELGNSLYDKAFQGTKDITPNISEKTNQAFSNLSQTWPGKRNAVARAVGRYNEDQSLENMHTLKSDLGKLQAKLNDKAIKSGLSGDEMDKQAFLGDAIDALSNDLDNNFNNLTPTKSQQYKVAQQHWKESVVPFRQFTSLKKLLGPEKEISARLYSDLSKKSVSADRLRELLGVSRPTMQTAGMLHHKVLGLPLPLYLTAGGAGLYGLRHKLEEML